MAAELAIDDIVHQYPDILKKPENTTPCIDKKNEVKVDTIFIKAAKRIARFTSEDPPQSISH